MTTTYEFVTKVVLKSGEELGPVVVEYAAPNWSEIFHLQYIEYTESIREDPHFAQVCMLLGIVLTEVPNIPEHLLRFQRSITDPNSGTTLHYETRHNVPETNPHETYPS